MNRDHYNTTFALLQTVLGQTDDEIAANFRSLCAQATAAFHAVNTNMNNVDAALAEAEQELKKGGAKAVAGGLGVLLGVVFAPLTGFASLAISAAGIGLFGHGMGADHGPAMVKRGQCVQLRQHHADLLTHLQTIQAAQTTTDVRSSAARGIESLQAIFGILASWEA